MFKWSKGLSMEERKKIEALNLRQNSGILSFSNVPFFRQINKGFKTILFNLNTSEVLEFG